MEDDGVGLENACMDEIFNTSSEVVYLGYFRGLFIEIFYHLYPFPAIVLDLAHLYLDTSGRNQSIILRLYLQISSPLFLFTHVQLRMEIYIQLTSILLQIWYSLSLMIM
jgi:hypothetical protein